MARFQSGTEIREVALEGDDRRTYCERQRALLAAGWQRIHDPARETTFVEDPREPTLERAIHDNFDDDQTWLVYADHLIEHGHPRGQLVAIEAAPVKNIVQRAEREAEARRLRLADSNVLGAGISGRAGLHLRWRRGYIHHARLSGGFVSGEAEDVLFDLLRHPSARFLRELTIACWHGDARDHRLLVALLLHAASPPPLRLLHIEYDADEWNDFPPLGDLAALGTIYPQLEDVELAGNRATRLAGLALPRARRFAFDTIDAQPETLHAIASAPWPHLEELVLRLAESTCTLDELRFVLALPQLRRLRLQGLPFANELVHALVASPLAPRLDVLDLRTSRLDDRGVELLVAARQRFPAELRCYLAHTQVSHEGRERLRDADISVEDWWSW